MREKVTNLQDTFYQPGAIYSINKISDHSGIIAILWENIDVGWIGRYLGENKTKPFKYPIRRNMQTALWKNKVMHCDKMSTTVKGFPRGENNFQEYQGSQRRRSNNSGYYFSIVTR